MRSPNQDEELLMATAANTTKVIELLNAARASELTAILQYMAQHYELENQDYGKLAKYFKTVAIAEMKHAEALADRILFLGGVPTSKPDGTAKKGQTLAEMLATNLGLEAGAVKMYNDSAKACAELLDHVSKDLFESLLADEDGHFDEFQNLQEHAEKLGTAWLAQQTGAGE
jgi:bacterioferritin